MPTTPLYTHKLAEGAAALGAMTADWIGRRTLEEVLGVSKWTAWRILKRCGAQEGPGGSLVWSNLGALQQGFAPEIARRNRVELYPDGIAQYASRKHKQIARNQAAVDC